MFVVPDGVGREAGANDGALPPLLTLTLASFSILVVMGDPRRLLTEVYVSVRSALKWNG